MAIEQQIKDVPVGQLIEGELIAQVSVRGETIILGFKNKLTLRGVEVAFSPKAMEQFNDHAASAVRLALGRGLAP